MTRTRNDRIPWAKQYSNLTCYELADLYAGLMSVVLGVDVWCCYKHGWIITVHPLPGASRVAWNPNIRWYPTGWGHGGKQRPSDIRREIEKALNEHRRIPAESGAD